MNAPHPYSQAFYLKSIARDAIAPFPYRDTIWKLIGICNNAASKPLASSIVYTTDFQYIRNFNRYHAMEGSTNASFSSRSAAKVNPVTIYPDEKRPETIQSGLNSSYRPSPPESGNIQNGDKNIVTVNPVHETSHSTDPFFPSGEKQYPDRPASENSQQQEFQHAIRNVPNQLSRDNTEIDIPGFTAHPSPYTTAKTDDQQKTVGTSLPQHTVKNFSKAKEHLSKQLKRDLFSGSTQESYNNEPGTSQEISNDPFTGTVTDYEIRNNQQVNPLPCEGTPVDSSQVFEPSAKNDTIMQSRSFYNSKSIPIASSNHSDRKKRHPSTSSQKTAKAAETTDSFFSAIEEIRQASMSKESLPDDKRSESHDDIAKIIHTLKSVQNANSISSYKRTIAHPKNTGTSMHINRQHAEAAAEEEVGPVSRQSPKNSQPPPEHIQTIVYRQGGFPTNNFHTTFLQRCGLSRLHLKVLR